MSHASVTRTPFVTRTTTHALLARELVQNQSDRRNVSAINSLYNAEPRPFRTTFAKEGRSAGKPMTSQLVKPLKLMKLSTSRWVGSRMHACTGGPSGRGHTFVDTEIKVALHYKKVILQPADIGWPTGNGKKLRCSQAQLGQATCLGAA